MHASYLSVSVRNLLQRLNVADNDVLRYHAAQVGFEYAERSSLATNPSDALEAPNIREMVCHWRKLLGCTSC